MLCNKCYQPSCSGNCGCDDCVDSCPIKLDFSCILYNKDGKDASNLTGLNLPNGSTLKLVAELLDQKIRQLNVVNYSLPILRADHTILTFQQFGEAVDQEISDIKDSLDDIGGNVSTDLSVIDSTTIDLIATGTGNHTLTANVKIGSPESSNCLISQSDGLVAVPQILSLNYTTKELTISKGNTVNLSSLVSSTYLGNTTSDPTAIDGNYWYNTTQSKLKIKVNGVVKEILTA